jgi:hypothetical protein
MVPARSSVAVLARFPDEQSSVLGIGIGIGIGI